MEELVNEIQIVINTLNGGLDFPANYKNCATLVACIDKLVNVRDKLIAQGEIKVEVGNGDSDTE